MIISVFYLIILQLGCPNLTAGTKIGVPLWVAMHLKKLNHCTICTPSWMEPDALAEKIIAEKAAVDSFQELPHYYSEVAHMIHSSMKADLPGSVETKRNLVELEMRRKEKFEQLVEGIQ